MRSHIHGWNMAWGWLAEREIWFSHVYGRVLQIGIRVGCTLFGSYLIPQIGIRAWFHSHSVNLLVMHACQLHVCLLHLYCVLVALHNFDHSCSRVAMRNLMIAFMECIIRSIWLVTWAYVAWLHPFMLGCTLDCLITCISLVGWLQELIAYASLHVFIHMCSWLGIAYACW